MKIHISIFFLLLLSLTAFGQNYERIDSIKIKLKDQMSDIQRIDLYNQLGWELRKNEPDSTIYYAQRSLDLLKRNDLKKGLAMPLNYMGVGYHYKGNNLKSYEYYNLALEEALRENDSSQYAHGLNSLGRLYFNQGDFIKSYDTFYKAIAIFKGANDLDGLGYCYKSLSELYQTQKNYEKALEMSKKSLDIRLKTNNIRGQISILIEIAGIYGKIRNFGKAFDHFLQAKVKAESLDDKINIANTDLGISQLYFSEEKYEEALIFGIKAENAAKRANNQDLLSQIELQLGKVYFELATYEKSEKYLNQVIVDAEKSKDLSLKRDAYYYLSEMASKRHDIEENFDYFLKYTTLNEALDNAEVARKIERLESRYEIENKSRENEILKVQKARDKAIIERQQIQNIALVVIVFVVSILLASIWIMSHKRRTANLKLKERNEEIAAQREEISRQNHHINAQNEDLQKRNGDLAQLNQEKDILMNIVAHDLKSPFNRIKGIAELLNLSGLNDEQRNYNGLLQEISQSGIDLIRDLLDVNSFEDDGRKQDISKVDAGDMLLEKAKYFYADAKSKNIEIVTDVKDAHAYLYTDGVYLSRILDNLISNAIKFSGPRSKVTVGAVKTDKLIHISIQDEGQGFMDEDKKHLYKKFTRLSAQPTAGENSNGLGLAIVKTLVDRLTGEIILETKVGKGSKFTLVFPIKYEQKKSIQLTTAEEN